MKKVLNILSILFGLEFVLFGANKFFHFIPMPEDMPAELVKVMGAFMEVGWLLPLAGIIEVLAGLLIIIPKFRALGAIMILPIIVGILLTHTVNDPQGLPMALILTAIELWLIIDNKDKYMHMIS